jgi:hypothetical protein
MDVAIISARRSVDSIWVSAMKSLTSSRIIEALRTHVSCRDVPEAIARFWREMLKDVVGPPQMFQIMYCIFVFICTYLYLQYIYIKISGRLEQWTWWLMIPSYDLNQWVSSSHGWTFAKKKPHPATKWNWSSGQNKLHNAMHKQTQIMEKTHEVKLHAPASKTCVCFCFHHV